MSQLAPTKESFAINVGEVKIERGNTQIGEDKLTLYKYQEEVYRSRAELITIDAPTGAGKTLAMLLVAKKILEEGENALILYPTKALIKDQWESLKNLASKIGLNTEIIMVDADVLHKHAMNKGFKTHGEALLDLLSVGVPKVVLSNPDVVYYILRLYYKHGKSIFNSY